MALFYPHWFILSNYRQYYITYMYNCIYLGKLEYFTNLNLAAMAGDDFPNINYDSRVRSQ